LKEFKEKLTNQPQKEQDLFDNGKEVLLGTNKHPIKKMTQNENDFRVISLL
jgi:hypothetical protein